MSNEPKLRTKIEALIMNTNSKFFNQLFLFIILLICQNNYNKNWIYSHGKSNFNMFKILNGV